jgi:cell division protein DivIC
MKGNKYLIRSAKKRQNRFSVTLVIIVVILLAVVLGVGKYNNRKKLAEYEKQKEQLAAQIESEQERATEIEEYEKYTKTKKYAEEVAKEKLGLVGEDEIIFKSENE